MFYLVAGASLTLKWSYTLNLTQLNITQVIEFIEKKKKFTRLDIEKEFNVDSGRSYWHIRKLLTKKLIVKTDEKLNLKEKGKVYAVYRMKL